MKQVSLPSPKGRKLGYVRVGNGGVPTFRYADDHTWFCADRKMWEGMTPDDLRAVAEAKEHPDL